MEALKYITNIKKIFTIAVYSSLILSSGFIIFLSLYFLKPLNIAENKKYILEIEKGDSLHKVTTKLSDDNIIQFPKVLRGILYLSGKDSNVHIGEYELSNKINIMEFINKIITGDVKQYSLAIPEGGTVDDIIRKIILSESLGIDELYSKATQEQLLKIEDYTLIKHNIFVNLKKYVNKTADRKDILINLDEINSLEGLFKPDTYFYVKGDVAQDILNKSFIALNEDLNKLWLNSELSFKASLEEKPGLKVAKKTSFKASVETSIEASPKSKVASNIKNNSNQLNIKKTPSVNIKAHIKSPYDALILASILEKEASDSNERKLVSGVIYNRLDKNMLLQMDPTVIYAMGLKYNGKISKADLSIKSDYNTYYKKGLPPTPISTVSYDSIKAALNPVKHDLLYFVSMGNGKHYFSSSLDKHNSAVRKYQLNKDLTKSGLDSERDSDKTQQN